MFEADERQRRNVVAVVVEDFMNVVLELAVLLKALLACMRQADLAMFLESISLYVCLYVASELAVWKSPGRFFRRKE